jgi:hypothetical protein
MCKQRGVLRRGTTNTFELQAQPHHSGYQVAHCLGCAQKYQTGNDSSDEQLEIELSNIPGGGDVHVDAS